ncbi:glucose 1-dehydrogenase [Weizmannia coagulans]|uniref:Short-chain dehydrogenase n=2 Tax=Heyndrickxia TaxID=2837504 RepID=A0AAN0T2G2_HEYCO|nr:MULTISPECIES: glucose 1-dehydrogenase [Heyndrickxia]AJO21417.1 short-chain dehydrogenase [Heyndrickxia coagulans]AKN52956.1 3-oxoacyl-[acyl-carrier protein] reductase [Heyndrickxia coagulans]ATW82006.1 3-oxoacyl-ACP reductase [Heyndrickxia coagulans]KGB29527.1 short-chain dehydrogenase [Heyndrickxia coagulans]KXT20179.1 short-chain dehydrogenase [Heyndrickxia coagulans]
MNKVAIVTGGGSGLGQAVALRLEKEGVHIVVVDIQEEGGNATVEKVKALGVDSFFVKADVSKPEEVKNYVDQTVNRFGTIDYFFNNAGISGSGKFFLDSTIEEINQIVGINLLGALYGAHYVGEVVVNNGGGSIVNTSSSAGVIGQDSVVTYSATKHGIVGLTKSLVAEYAKDGLRVNAIAPGPTETPMVKAFYEANPEMKENATRGIPQKRLGTPEEVAELVTFLLTSKAEYINGEVIRIDGGFTNTK